MEGVRQKGFRESGRKNPGIQKRPGRKSGRRKSGSQGVREGCCIDCRLHLSIPTIGSHMQLLVHATSADYSTLHALNIKLLYMVLQVTPGPVILTRVVMAMETRQNRPLGNKPSNC